MLLTLAKSAARNRVITLLLAGVLCLVAAPGRALASIQTGSGAFNSDAAIDLALIDPNISAEQLDKVLEQLAASSATGSSAAGSSADTSGSGHRNADAPAPDGTPDSPPTEVRHYANLNPDAGTPGGSTTSTSSSAGAAGGMGLALYAAAAPHLSDDAPVERYAAERSLFLPEAPGTELLRPPRG